MILPLGFASGLPLLLTFSTLSAWLATAGVKRSAIGAFALAGTPYALKFLVGALDRPPAAAITAGTAPRMGRDHSARAHRRDSGLGTMRPQGQPAPDGRLALAVAFLSASQDIVIDAYRVELLYAGQQGPGAGMIQTGYRIGDAGRGSRRVDDRRVRRMVRRLCADGGVTSGGHGWYFSAVPNRSPKLAARPPRRHAAIGNGSRPPSSPRSATSCGGRYGPRFSSLFRLQAGRSDGRRDVDAALHRTRVLAGTNRRRIQAGGLFRDDYRRARRWRIDGPHGNFSRAAGLRTCCNRQAISFMSWSRRRAIASIISHSVSPPKMSPARWPEPLSSPIYRDYARRNSPPLSMRCYPRWRRWAGRWWHRRAA